MKLLKIDEAVSILGTRDASDLRSTISFLLDRVTTSLEAFLKTDFGENSSRTDIFRLGEGEYFESQSSLLMVLSRTLINTEAASLVIKRSDDYSELSGADPLTSVPLLDSQRGMVRYIPSADFTLGDYISVNYACGLPVNSEDPTVYTNVPTWLRDVVGAYLFEAYNSHKVMNSDKGRTAYKSVSGMRLPSIVPSVIPPPSPGVISLMEPYTRFNSAGLIPIGSIDG